MLHLTSYETWLLDPANTVEPFMMPMLAQNASHDEKSSVAPFIYHCNLRNAVVPLMILLVLCDPDANPSDAM